jgi:hypothetical protein
VKKTSFLKKGSKKLLPVASSNLFRVQNHLFHATVNRVLAPFFKKEHFLLSCFLLLAAAPHTMPLRDVDVTYKVPVAGGQDMAILQRLRFSASLHRQRVDLPTSGNWMVLDYLTHRMTLVRDESHELVDLPAPDNAAAASDFAKVGPAEVAGLPCTEWRTRDTRGEETVACYTDDGVLLRARGARGVLMEAIDVGYRAQGADVFALPQGYSRQQPSP